MFCLSTFAKKLMRKYPPMFPEKGRKVWTKPLAVLVLVSFRSRPCQGKHNLALHVNLKEAAVGIPGRFQVCKQFKLPGKTSVCSWFFNKALLTSHKNLERIELKICFPLCSRKLAVSQKRHSHLNCAKVGFWRKSRPKDPKKVVAKRHTAKQGCLPALVFL